MNISVQVHYRNGNTDTSYFNADLATATLFAADQVERVDVVKTTVQGGYGTLTLTHSVD
jgi:hypothetical protein